MDEEDKAKGRGHLNLDEVSNQSQCDLTLFVTPAGVWTSDLTGALPAELTGRRKNRNKSENV